jgi:predicted AAA+ superfamily ATPase
MTGSSSVGMLDAASDTLAGRINILDLPTACFGEDSGSPTHHIFHEQQNPSQLAEANRNLDRGIHYGQFPEVLSTRDDIDKENILKNYRDTYFTRDLMQMSNMENLDGLLSIFAHLARSIGSHLEISNFAREAGMSHPSTKKYLNNLNLSQLTFRLYGYQYGPAKRFIKASKTYFADNGIIKSLNIPLNEGQLLENFVIAEFEKRRKLGFIKCERLYYYKSAAGREIDLVFESENHIYAVEIKNTKNPSQRDVKNLMEFSRQLKRKCKLFLFYMGTEYFEINGVKILPVATLFIGK